MWDTYNVSKETTRTVPYAKTVNVTENKAVTDRSISLLQEMQEKARASLLDSFTLESTALHVAVRVYDVHMYDRVEAYYKFTLNGEEIQGREAIPIWDFGHEYDQSCVDLITQRIIKAASDTIANHFVGTFRYVTRHKCLDLAMREKGSSFPDVGKVTQGQL